MLEIGHGTIHQIDIIDIITGIGSDIHLLIEMEDMDTKIDPDMLRLTGWIGMAGMIGQEIGHWRGHTGIEIAVILGAYHQIDMTGIGIGADQEILHHSRQEDEGTIGDRGITHLT